MSGSSLIQIRVDDQLKREVTDIYEQLGLDLPTAIRMFLKKSVATRGIPFDTKLPDKVMTGQEALEALREQALCLPDMSVEEIAEEIAAARRDRGLRR